jgi:pyruvate dehydrogenase E1 component beta subunit
MAVPGLRVVCPSTPEDLVGLFQSAVADDDPVVFLEHKGLFAIKGEVPESPFAIPLGEAKVLRSGADVTVVSIAATVHTALAAAETLSTRDVDVEVLDLRCLAPLDMVAVARSVEKTARVVLVEEGPGVCGWTDHVAARLSDEHLDLLDGPVRRVTGALAPLPFSKVLEHAALPGEADVVRAIESLL